MCGLFSAAVIVVCLRSLANSTPDQRHFFSSAVLQARASVRWFALRSPRYAWTLKTWHHRAGPPRGLFVPWL